MLTLKELEYLHIFDCLKKNEFHRGNTHKELGISERTLRTKLKEMKSLGYNVHRLKSQETIHYEEEFFIFGMATNEERLAHADSMINRNYL